MGKGGGAMRKAIIIIVSLFLLSGCGGYDDDGGNAENCRWVRFIPLHGDSYYIYTCDDRSDLVRNEINGTIR